MRYSHALLISALFPFAFWLPFSWLPDTTYQLQVNHYSSEPTILVAEKQDLALLWFILLLAFNPFPWLMWACILRDLKHANRQLQAHHLAQLQATKLANFQSNFGVNHEHTN